jgi:hypothetical protein
MGYTLIVVGIHLFIHTNFPKFHMSCVLVPDYGSFLRLITASFLYLSPFAVVSVNVHVVMSPRLEQVPG